MGQCVVEGMRKRAQAAGLECEVVFENVDILRDGSGGNLLVNDRQTEILAKILEGFYDAVLAAPPCNTFSRALWHDQMGPPPLRSRAEPWGLKKLSDHLQKRVSEANNLLKFALLALEAATKCKTKWVGAWLEFPEDLGDANLGSPASLWQLPESRNISKMGLKRGAIFQCEWGGVNYTKPTGILTNIQAMVDDAGFHEGWPQLAAVSCRSSWLVVGCVARSSSQ